ncbi:hypothetical protein BASA83_010288 [Batrachochytrium salamandrivorans]|nr:hypothetical protein BASA83_010288 [Batrachochytrium salamandrivorans]
MDRYRLLNVIKTTTIFSEDPLIQLFFKQLSATSRFRNQQQQLISFEPKQSANPNAADSFRQLTLLPRPISTSHGHQFYNAEGPLSFWNENIE